PQHLSGLETVRDLCCGQLENAHIGSTEINFAPGRIKGGALTADTKTAGGYYPRGGGEILVRVSPIKYLKPINLTDRGTITKIYGRAFVAGVLPYKMVKDMISAAVRCIRRELRDLYVNIQGVQEPADKAVGNGYKMLCDLTREEAGWIHGCFEIVMCFTSTIDSIVLCTSGVTADRVGAEAAEILLRNLRHGGCVDEYLQDQAKFTVTKCDEPNTDSNIIECQGTGMQNKNAS
ncbi:hypothetical protein AB205_0063110, partial [Aquarana catesbeiana]